MILLMSSSFIVSSLEIAAKDRRNRILTELLRGYFKANNKK